MISLDNPTYDELMKEHKALLKEQKYDYYDRRVTSSLWSLVIAFVMFGVLSIILAYAALGVHAGINNGTVSGLAANFATLVLNIGGGFLIVYIWWHFFIVMLYMWKEELEELGKRIVVYCDAGRMALREYHKKQIEKE